MNPRGPLVVALLAVVAAGCVGDVPATGVDAGDGDAGIGEGDGGDIGSGGIRLRFKAEPRPPVEVGGDFDCSLGKIDIDLTNLRVVGDAAPGDERTRIDSMELKWPREGGDPEVRFDEAPPGMYSFVLATITEYRIEGTATVGTEMPFELEEEFASLTLSIPLGDLIVESGETKTIDIAVELDDLVRELRWDEVEMEEGTLKVEDDSPMIGDVRTGVIASFQGPSGGAE